jgi:hypothetical protein
VFRIRIWIRIQESKEERRPTRKKEKSEEISCFEVLDVLFGGAGGFYCSLKALRRAIRIKNKNIAF